MEFPKKPPKKADNSYRDNMVFGRSGQLNGQKLLPEPQEGVFFMNQLNCTNVRPSLEDKITQGRWFVGGTFK